MKKQTTVLEDMGEIGIVFAYVSPDRKNFKWVRSMKKSERCHRTWNQAIQCMPQGLDFYALVTRTKPAPKSKSGYTFEIVGVLCGFDNFEDAQSVNKQFWGKSKFLDGQEKIEWTREFATCLKNYYFENAPGDFSNTTYDKLMELTKV